MTKIKLKTMKEIEEENIGLYPGDVKIIKQGAIKWLLHALKKRKNPYKAFMDFHNIIPEELVKE